MTSTKTGHTPSAGVNKGASSRTEPETLSGLAGLASVLSPAASMLPEKSNDNKVPGHIANILKVILLHDKFEQNFAKWSLVTTDDRDIVVLTLKNGAWVDSSLVYTICMMYPFRINGPIIIKNCMHVEFLHENRLEVVNVTSKITQENIEYQLGTCLHSKKRRRQSVSNCTAAPTSLNETTAGVINIEPELNIANIRQKLSASLLTTNSSRVFVENVDTGLDAGGSWAIFRLSECDKLNLDFIGAFQLSIDDFPVKVFSPNLRIPSIRICFYSTQREKIGPC